MHLKTKVYYLAARDEIASAAVAYMSEDQTARLHARSMAFLTSAKTDWKYIITHYDEAFRIALSRHSGK